MNSKTPNDKYANNRKKTDLQQNNNKYKSNLPNSSYPQQNQEKQKNIKYFPITAKDTFTGQPTIYLAAEDISTLNDNTDNVTTYEYHYSNSNKIKKENKILF